MTATLTASRRLAAPVMLFPDRGVTLVQRDATTVLALVSGDRDVEARLASTLPGPFPVQRLATSRFRRIVSTDGAPLLGRLKPSRLFVVAGLGSPPRSSRRRSPACSPAKLARTTKRWFSAHDPARAATARADRRSRRRGVRMTQPNRLAADAAHQFGGIELDRSKPLSLRLDGHHIDGFAGDTVLSAALAAGIDTHGPIGELPLALTERFAPLVVSRRAATHPRAALPMNRAPALDGLDLVTLGPRTGSAFSTPFNRGTHSLRHRLETLTEPAWLRTEPDTTLIADLLIIGGGVAGLTAADAAATAGHRVILVERRPWLGGDARYFGAVGDEESPEQLTTRLLAKVRAARRDHRPHLDRGLRLPRHERRSPITSRRWMESCAAGSSPSRPPASCSPPARRSGCRSFRATVCRASR